MKVATCPISHGWGKHTKREKKKKQEKWIKNVIMVVTGIAPMWGISWCCPFISTFPLSLFLESLLLISLGVIWLLPEPRHILPPSISQYAPWLCGSMNWTHLLLFRDLSGKVSDLYHCRFPSTSKLAQREKEREREKTPLNSRYFVMSELIMLTLLKLASHFSEC